MKVLVTNDDGVGSPGLWVLADAVRDAGHDAVVVAPSSERSGSGAAIGHIVPGEGVAVAPVERPGWESRAWAVEGAPALCVLLAVRMGAFGDGFQAIASGVNPGWNTGRAVIHSGTVGAVLTGGNAGLSGVAVSIQGPTQQVGEVGLRPGIREHWETAAVLAVEALAHVEGCDEATMLNLNVPNVPLDQVPGVKPAELARFAAASMRPTSKEIGPDGLMRFDLGPPITPPVPGTDNYLLFEGWATVTALTAVGGVADGDAADRIAEAVAAGLGSADR